MGDWFDIGSAALGFAGSVYNTHQNRKSVESTNQMNLQIARETNQANKDLYQQQFQDTLKMQQMQNEYNSAPAQVQRLRQAGLNPALTFGGSSSVSPLSVPSAAPAQTGAPMQAFTQNYSDSPVAAALSALGSMAASSKDSQEAKGIRIENQYRDELVRQNLAESQQRIQEGLERIKNSKADRKQKAAATRELVAKSVQLDYLNQITEGSMGELSKSAYLQNLQTDAQIQLLREQKQYQTEQILSQQLSRVLSLRADSRAARELDSIIALNMSNANLASMQSRFTEKEVDNYSQRLLNSIWSNKLLKQEFEQNGWNFEKYKKQLYPLVRDQMRLGVYMGVKDVTNYHTNQILGVVRSTAPAFIYGGMLKGGFRSAGVGTAPSNMYPNTSRPANAGQAGLDEWLRNTPPNQRQSPFFR